MLFRSLEVMVAGVKAGLDPDLMIAAINAGSGHNTATEDKIPRAVLTRSFDFGFPISGACKDIGLAIEECQALGLPMLVGSAARQLWQFAYNQGGGNDGRLSVYSLDQRAVTYTNAGNLVADHYGVTNPPPAEFGGGATAAPKRGE